jgi:hypothetical protein
MDGRTQRVPGTEGSPGSLAFRGFGCASSPGHPVPAQKFALAPVLTLPTMWKWLWSM